MRFDIGSTLVVHGDRDLIGTNAWSEGDEVILVRVGGYYTGDEDRDVVYVRRADQRDDEARSIFLRALSLPPETVTPQDRYEVGQTVRLTEATFNQYRDRGITRDGVITRTDGDAYGVKIAESSGGFGGGVYRFYNQHIEGVVSGGAPVETLEEFKTRVVRVSREFGRRAGHGDQVEAVLRSMGLIQRSLRLTIEVPLPQGATEDAVITSLSLPDAATVVSREVTGG